MGMSYTDQLATEVMKEGDDVTEVFVDPATIILTVKVISTLICLYKNCKKSHQEATVSCNEMGPIQQRIIKRELRQQMGPLKYISNGGPRLAEKIMNRAKRLNEAEMERLYEENND